MRRTTYVGLGVLAGLFALAFLPESLAGALLLAAMLAGVYSYGIRVGHRAGVAQGRRVADAEWGRMMEHGAIPEPLPRDAGMFSPSEIERWQ